MQRMPYWKCETCRGGAAVFSALYTSNLASLETAAHN